MAEAQTETAPSDDSITTFLSSLPTSQVDDDTETSESTSIKDEVTEAVKADEPKETVLPATEETSKSESPVTDEIPDPTTSLQKQLDESNRKSEEAEERRKDSERTYQREHQELVRIQKQLADAEAEKDAAALASEDWVTTFRSQMDELDNPADAIEGALLEMGKRIAAQEKAIDEKLAVADNAVQLREEAVVRSAHEDFDDVVKGFFVPVVESNAGVMKEWQDKGSTVQAAYDIGTRLKDTSEIQKDPDAYRQQLEQQIRAEIASGVTAGDSSRTKTTSLAGVNSQTEGGVKASALESLPTDDLGSDAIAFINRKRK